MPPSALGSEGVPDRCHRIVAERSDPYGPNGVRRQCHETITPVRPEHQIVPWHLNRAGSGSAVRSVIGSLGILDWIAVALLAAGSLCVASGLLPVPDARETVGRILPLLLFLASVIVLAELTAEAEVFDVIAARVAIIARGRYFALFLLCVAFAAATTISLNLDTTAVLLTPVMLALARSEE